MEDPLPETLVTPPLGVSLANVTIRRRRNKRRRFGLHGSPPENFTEEDQAIIQHFDFAQCQDEEISWLEDKENCPVGGNNTRDSKEPAHSKRAICSAKKRLLTAAQPIGSKERPRRRKPQLPLQNACVLTSPLDGRSAQGRARSLRAARISKRSHIPAETETRSQKSSKCVAPLCGLQRLFGG